MKPHQRITRMEGSYLSAELIGDQNQNHHHCISASGVASMLLRIALVLLLLHLATFWIVTQGHKDSDFLRRLDAYFNFNHENNFPSFFSSILLLLSAFLLWVVYKSTAVTDTGRSRWLLLSAIFLFLTLDEAVRIHERIEQVTRLVFTSDAGGFLAWTWIIPYTLFAVAVALYNYRFVMRFPKPVRTRFIVSGALFVFAAAGIESIEGYLMKATAEDPVVLMITTTVQEFLEMVSIIVFVAGILHYLALRSKKLDLTFKP
ncbi:MAG TPA: hypothetical protein VGE06_09290 [Flavisolibacter sp.]